MATAPVLKFCMLKCCLYTVYLASCFAIAAWPTSLYGLVPLSLPAISCSFCVSGISRTIKLLEKYHTILVSYKWQPCTSTFIFNLLEIMTFILTVSFVLHTSNFLVHVIVLWWPYVNETSVFVSIHPSVKQYYIISTH